MALGHGVTARANAVLRGAILGATTNPAVTRLVRRHGMRLGAARFVAGETLDDCLAVLRRLGEQGLMANTTILGEAVRDEAETRAVVAAYREVLDRIVAGRLQANVALKLTHLGLELDEELAYANVAELVRYATALGTFVRIDMEQSPFVEPTLRTYRRLREDGLDDVGTVLQSYLYRSEDDLRVLLPLRPNLRLVKGAYLEHPSIAYPDKADVDAAFQRMVEASMAGEGYTAVATHDERMIRHAIDTAKRLGLGRDRWELQMLYGVRQQLQLDLARQGHRVRVATPHGPDWYAYLMRRMAERPANLLFVLRNAARG